MNKRVVVFVSTSIILVGLVCITVYALTLPFTASKVSAATQTAIAMQNASSTAQVAFTQTSAAGTETERAQQNIIATNEALLTRTAIAQQTEAALWATQTQQAVPTPTVTSTPVPVQSNCRGQILQSTELKKYPSEGYILDSSINASSTVTIRGTIEDKTWYLIEQESLTGWIENNVINVLDNCNPTIYDLQYSIVDLRLDDKVFEDTFDLPKGWSYNNQPLDRIPSDGDYQLTLLADQTATIKALDNLSGNFRMALSIERFSGYVSIQYGDAIANWNVRLLASCRVEFYANSAFVDDNLLSVNKNSCNDRQGEFLLIDWNANNGVLSVTLNDAVPVTLPLNDFNVDYPVTGSISITPVQTNLRINFIAVTQPR